MPSAGRAASTTTPRETQAHETQGSDQVSDTIETPTAQDDVVDELRTWLDENWDPDLTVGEWWQRLGLAGWAAPGAADQRVRPWPLPQRRGAGADRAIAEFGALGAPGGLGLLLAAPTIATHGTQEQIDRYVRDIVTGAKAWCQLFSEPGAGSDLAGLDLQGRARRRRVDRQRPEGVDLVRPHGRPGHAHRPHRPRRAQAPGHHLVRVRHAPARRRGAAAASR